MVAIPDHAPQYEVLKNRDRVRILLPYDEDLYLCLTADNRDHTVKYMFVWRDNLRPRPILAVHPQELTRLLTGLYILKEIYEREVRKV